MGGLVAAIEADESRVAITLLLLTGAPLGDRCAKSR